jgi:hypothetical protein
VAAGNTTNHQTVAPPSPLSTADVEGEGGERGGKEEEEKPQSQTCVALEMKTEKIEKVIEKEKSFEVVQSETSDEVLSTMRPNDLDSTESQVVQDKKAGNSKALNNNNNKVLLKSDSGFSEQERAEVARNQNKNKSSPRENVEAIYKSDSGYSEQGVMASSEDEEPVPVKVKQISVEDAHNLFDKRYSALVLGQDDLGLMETAKVVSPLKKAPHAIEEDSEEDSEDDDDDESDEDSVADPKGRIWLICLSWLTLNYIILLIHDQSYHFNYFYSCSFAGM